MKDYYKDEISDTVEKLKNDKNNFIFAVIADTHLDNSLDDTLENIKCVDEQVNFRFLAHLGDVINGGLSREYADMVLNEQFGKFRRSVKSKKFYIAQGNHDGYCDVANEKDCISTDGFWHKETSFLDNNDNLVRHSDNPYYYVDFPDERIRLVFICSFESEAENTRKGIGKNQKEWLKNNALLVGSDWSVMFFSHDVPLEFGDFGDRDVFDLVVDAREKYGFSIPAWFIGHFHGDLVMNEENVNFVFVASETAYVPQLWTMPRNGYYPERELDTVTEDLWDAVSLNKSERRLDLIRFGAGTDRTVKY